MRFSPLRCTEDIQVKKTRESTRDRGEILLEKQAKELLHLNEKGVEKKAKQIKQQSTKEGNLGELEAE